MGNQNQLRPEDIEHIVSTYRTRTRIAKFSHVAERSEVEENDYNLNIPRYVDTFDEEEHIDLAAVSSQLIALEGDMTATNQQLAAFCQELGISPPFSTRR